MQTKPKLTLDEFFNYTMFSILDFSPNNQYLLFQTKHPSWNTNSYENHLWIYDIQQQTRKLITKNLHNSIKPQWSPNGTWIALVLDEPSNTTNPNSRTKWPIYLYSPASNDLFPIRTENDSLLALTWSDNDFSFYLATINSQSLDEYDEEEWKDVNEYRKDIKDYEQSTIYHIDINQNNPRLLAERNFVTNVSFLIGQLLFAPLNEKLICTSVTSLIENYQAFEIYSIDLRNTSSSSSLIRLTDNEVIEDELEI
jgi:Tol biopolymer transport system component